MYTEWGVTYDVYRMRCKWHMMYTEWGVTYDVYRMRCKWYMMYTEWGVSDIWCIQNEVSVNCVVFLYVYVPVLASHISFIYIYLSSVWK
jgi:hypothetical protein